MTCKWQVEKDADARGVLRRRFANVARYEDVINVGRRNLEPVDLICGGFPCQDVSVAGRRAGLAGERSGLWFEFARVVDELEPQWVVAENVPGLLSSNGGRDFAVIIHGLVKFGYGVCWRVFDAQYFGVAQRRRRVFIVGSFRDGRAAEVLFEREGLRRDSQAKRAKGQTSPTLFASGAGTSRVASAGSESEFLITADTLTSGGNGHRGHQDPVNMTLITSNTITTKEGRRSSPDSETLVLANPLGSHHAPRNDLDNETYVFDWQSGGDVRLNVSKETSGTLHAGQTPAVMSSGVRRLMPVECERLQGFPDGWTDGQADSVRYKQLGNAVAVPVAEWIGERIVAVANEK
jgi:DNA (cytosine-5)-methyltransferase 1